MVYFSYLFSCLLPNLWFPHTHTFFLPTSPPFLLTIFLTPLSLPSPLLIYPLTLSCVQSSLSIPFLILSLTPPLIPFPLTSPTPSFSPSPSLTISLPVPHSLVYLPYPYPFAPMSPLSLPFTLYSPFFHFPPFTLSYSPYPVITSYLPSSLYPGPLSPKLGLLS